MVFALRPFPFLPFKCLCICVLVRPTASLCRVVDLLHMQLLHLLLLMLFILFSSFVFFSFRLLFFCLLLSSFVLCFSSFHLIKYSSQSPFLSLSLYISVLCYFCSICLCVFVCFLSINNNESLVLFLCLFGIYFINT